MQDKFYNQGPYGNQPYGQPGGVPPPPPGFIPPNNSGYTAYPPQGPPLQHPMGGAGFFNDGNAAEANSFIHDPMQFSDVKIRHM
jgi:hypothetical protein